MNDAGSAARQAPGQRPAGHDPVRSIERWLAGSRIWQRLLLASGAGALTSLAFAPFHVGQILFVTLPALFLLIRDAARRRASNWQARAGDGAAVGWAFAFGFHLFGLHWIGHAFLVQADVFAWALPFAVTLLPAGLALFFALAGAAAALVPGRWIWPELGFVGAVFAAEFARSLVLTGFPWNVLGYALTWPIAMAQSAAWVGVHGLTMLVVALAIAPLLVWQRLSARPERGIGLRVVAALGTAGGPLALIALAGTLRLAGGADPTVPDVRIRIVQPSINQTEKWQPAAQAGIFERHLGLTVDGIGDAPPLARTSVTHVVWAEAAMPFLPLENRYALDRIAAALPEGVVLVTGLLRSDRLSPDAPRPVAAGPRRIFNSVAVLDDEARTLSVYDKRHLVPFGEYLPLPGLFEAIGFETLVRQQGGFARSGDAREVTAIPGLPPTEVLICYEAIFPDEVARTRIRPALLANLTNDGWFGTFAGPYQHFHQTRVRAIEQGIPLLRVSNNGISAMIDGRGRVLARLGLDHVGVADVALPVSRAPTLYARFGYVWLVILASAVVLIFWLFNRLQI